MSVWMLPGLRHRWLTTMWTLFTFFLNWKLRSERGVYGILGQAYTALVPDQRSLYPGGHHTLTFYTKCVTPMELGVLLSRV